MAKICWIRRLLRMMICLMVLECLCYSGIRKYKDEGRRKKLCQGASTNCAQIATVVIVTGRSLLLAHLTAHEFSGTPGTGGVPKPTMLCVNSGGPSGTFDLAPPPITTVPVGQGAKKVFTVLGERASTSSTNVGCNS